jgi:hypothetical protein
MMTEEQKELNDRRWNELMAAAQAWIDVEIFSSSGQRLYKRVDTDVFISAFPPAYYEKDRKGGSPVN